MFPNVPALSDTDSIQTQGDEGGGCYLNAPCDSHVSDVPYTPGQTGANIATAHTLGLHGARSQRLGLSSRQFV